MNVALEPACPPDTVPEDFAAPGPLDWVAAAAMLQEQMLDAAETVASGPWVGGMLLIPTIQLHGPVRPDVPRTVARERGLFDAQDRPACHGCNRSPLALLRHPLWPCRTADLFGRVLLNLPDLDAELVRVAELVRASDGDTTDTTGGGLGGGRRRAGRIRASRRGWQLGTATTTVVRL